MRILEYACERCNLLYREQHPNHNPNPRFGLCPRCGEFNTPEGLRKPETTVLPSGNRMLR
jgi:rubredoxin